jgi:LmbE family N-acetylglucosaminyl deacetylase
MIPFDGKKLLCVAAHVDDEVLPAGLITRARREGATCYVVAFSPAIESIPEGFPTDVTRKEFARSTNLLGLAVLWQDNLRVRRLWRFTDSIRERLAAIQRELTPDIVVCPASSDMHQDHEVIHCETRRIFRNAPLVLGWESPNNERGSFDARIFVKLSSEDVGRKKQAWRCYESQAGRYYNADLIDAMAVMRGAQCRSRTDLAEAYELLSVTL